MKKIILSAIFFIIFGHVSFAQESKIIFNEQGVTVTYHLSEMGLMKNPETGTAFNRYIIYLEVNNSSNKYWAYNSINILRCKNIKSGIISDPDERFCVNNGRAQIDHFCIEDNCSDFPRYNNVAAPHQVICPNSTQKCQKEFLHPTDLAGEPEIEWTSWGFTEMIENSGLANKSKKIMNTSKKNSGAQTPFNQSFAYKGNKNINGCRQAINFFISEHTIRPNIPNFNGCQVNLNFVVNENGKIVTPVAISDFPELNKATIKALMLTEKDWTIQIIDGKKVSTEMGLNIDYAVDGGHVSTDNQTKIVKTTNKNVPKKTTKTVDEKKATILSILRNYTKNIIIKYRDSEASNDPGIVSFSNYNFDIIGNTLIYSFDFKYGIDGQYKRPQIFHIVSNIQLKYISRISDNYSGGFTSDSQIPISNWTVFSQNKENENCLTLDFTGEIYNSLETNYTTINGQKMNGGVYGNIVGFNKGESNSNMKEIQDIISDLYWRHKAELN